jgi:transcriptional regulator with XRE-family HTH domain
VRIEEQIGKNLKGMRLKRKLSQEAVAGRANLQANYYSCIERGERMLSIPALLKFAKVLKVEPYLLLKPDGWKDVE